MIRISNLVFEYTNGEEKNRVLDGIDLTIREGESLGLMGPNGAGKTTLARCLNGLLLPTEGEVLVDDMNTNEAAKISEIRRLVGMVFQNPENQIVSTTVEREIAFGLENLGMDYERMHETVDKMLEQFDLQKYRNHPPHLLSGGEMQRLALASVMAMSPKYIVFDEPTSLLDLASRKALLSLISEFHKKNQTAENNCQISTIFITQYPEETLTFDRLLVLNKGRIVLDDKPAEIFQKVKELKNLGLEVPAEFEVNHYLKKLSNGKLSLNTSDFLPIP
ncbi:ATP-binding cassette domain-containing protein [candidate division KSB1 bacterium]|nr:ATP-binding cassette domain-containing protein [candidate division KSB1 bacterium]